MDNEIAALTWADRFADRTHKVDGSEIASMLRLSGPSDLVNFTGGFPDTSTFPKDLLADLARDAILERTTVALQYAPTEGLPELRDLLLTRFKRDDQDAVAQDELLITSGGIDALELLSKSFINPGDLVLTEGPTYLGALTSFAGFEADIISIDLEDDGISVDRLEEILRGGATPKLLYLIPDHQNPSSVTISTVKRQAIVDLARHYGFLIIEDVAYRQLAFDDEVLPSLHVLGPDVVVQIGTFSKTFSPGFRLGWAIGPAPIINQMTIAKQNTDQCSGALGQLMLASYGESGILDERVLLARRLYTNRAHTMVETLARTMPEGTRWSTPRGGFFVWLTLPHHIDTADLKVKAQQHGVAFVPGRPFYPNDQGVNELRLSYSRPTEDQIELGISRLADIIKSQH